MDHIKLEFEQAIVKHLLFKARLRSILYGIPTEEAPVLSPAECSLGKWIYDHALVAYGHIPEMTTLEAEHKELHMVANRLVQLFKDGKGNEARAGLTEIEDRAESLINILALIEKKITSQSQAQNPDTQSELSVSIKELEELTRANKELDTIIRNQSGKLLSERQMFYNVLMQLPATIAILKGPEHRFELANPPFLQGFAGREVIGKTVRELLPDLEGQGYFELIDHVYQTGDIYTGKEMPLSIRAEEGTELTGYIDLNYQAIRDFEGNIDSVLSFSYNVTDQVIARQKIEESEYRFRFMSNAMPVQVWTANSAGALEFVNKQTELYFGRSSAEIVGDGWQHVVHKEDLPGVIEKWTASLATGEPYEVEFRLKDKAGHYRWHLARAVAYTTSDKQVQWFGTNTDIHEMKMLQQQLVQSYEDLEVKVKFRNLDLERKNKELHQKLHDLLPDSQKD